MKKRDFRKKRNQNLLLSYLRAKRGTRFPAGTDPRACSPGTARGRRRACAGRGGGRSRAGARRRTSPF